MYKKRNLAVVFITSWLHMAENDSPLAYGAEGQVNCWLNVFGQYKEGYIYFCPCPNLSISIRHLGKI